MRVVLRPSPPPAPERELATYRGGPGQLMVIGAVALTVLLVLMAVIVNLGFLLGQRRTLQNAADAAAIAAGRKLLDEHTSRSFRDAQVLAAAQALARQNGVDVGGTALLAGAYVDQTGADLALLGSGGSFPSSATGVRVALSTSMATLVSPLLEIPSVPVVAEAVAQMKRTASSSTLVNPVPLAVPLAAFNAAASYDLYDQSVALAVYGVAGYLPFLNLAHPANTGAGYLPGTDFGDINVNLQYWSDGAHNSGTLTVGSTVAIASGSYGAYVRSGLLDNVRRQGLLDGSSASYALISLPVWSTYIPGSPDMIVVAAFATFKILASDIQTSSLAGYFVPSLAEFAGFSPVIGPMWGPNVVALSR